jgi:hypothetical protein
LKLAPIEPLPARNNHDQVYEEQNSRKHKDQGRRVKHVSSPKWSKKLCETLEADSNALNHGLVRLDRKIGKNWRRRDDHEGNHCDKKDGQEAKRGNQPRITEKISHRKSFLAILPEVSEWKNERKANEADELNNDANEERQSRRKKHLDNLKAILCVWKTSKELTTVRE